MEVRDALRQTLILAIESHARLEAQPQTFTSLCSARPNFTAFI